MDSMDSKLLTDGNTFNRAADSMMKSTSGPECL
jgi:hypothetical protein